MKTLKIARLQIPERVNFELDTQPCPNCGGNITFVTNIDDDDPFQCVHCCVHIEVVDDQPKNNDLTQFMCPECKQVALVID